MKITETNDFRLKVAEELLKKMQEELYFVESEVVEEEVREEVRSVQNTVLKLLLLVKDCQ